MSVNGLNLYSSKLRFSGLATGLDTDQIVSDLMKAERIPLSKLHQQKQLAEWKRDAYREITNLLRGFKDEYMNYLKPSSNMLSSASYKKFSVSVIDSATGAQSTAVSVSAGTDATAGMHTITVARMAKADKAVSGGGVTKALESVAEISAEDIAAINAGNAKNIRISAGGVTRQVTLGTSYTDVQSIADDLQAKIDAAFGSGKITVSKVAAGGGEGIRFDAAGANVGKITLYQGTTDGGLQYLHFSSGSSNRLNVSLSLAELADSFATPLTFGGEPGKEQLKFSINSKEFTFDSSQTLLSLMNTINADSDAKVRIAYDEAADKFTITAAQLGEGNNIVINSQTYGNFFSDSSESLNGAVKIDIDNPIVIAHGGQEGVDADVTINGQRFLRSGNIITLNGITYTLLRESATEQNVTLNADTDAIYSNILNFVNKYNEVIGKINEKLSEKYDRNYLPLTEEQKGAMKEDDIERWENKAKTGLLRNDRILEGIVRDMRKAMYETVDTLRLSSIGITSDVYSARGKLVVDESKLKQAIQNDPDGVMALFSRQSASYPIYKRTLTSEEMAVRYSEEGLVHRLYDIIEENVSTLRNSAGKKGILLEKAGLTGDISEYTNSYYREISGYDAKIKETNNKLVRKEENYFKKFSELEKIISKMNMQSNWLAAQFSQKK